MALISEEQFPGPTAFHDTVRDFIETVSRQMVALNRAVLRFTGRFENDWDAIEAAHPGASAILGEYNLWVQEVNKDYRDDVADFVLGIPTINRWNAHGHQLNAWGERLAALGIRSARVPDGPPPDDTWTFTTWVWILGGSIGAYVALRFVWRRFLQPTGTDRADRDEELRGVRYHRISPKPPSGRSDDGSSRALRVRRRRK